MILHFCRFVYTHVERPGAKFPGDAMGIPHKRARADPSRRSRSRPIRDLHRPSGGLVNARDLSAAKSRLFARLPEFELPRRLDVRACRRWIARIPAPYRRTMVARRLDAMLGARS